MSHYGIYILVAYGIPTMQPPDYSLTDTWLIAHRLVDQVDTPFADHQPITRDLTVDVSFGCGEEFCLEVANVANAAAETLENPDVVPVYFRWHTRASRQQVISMLEMRDYRVLDDLDSTLGMIPDFFPGLRV